MDQRKRNTINGTVNIESISKTERNIKGKLKMKKLEMNDDNLNRCMILRSLKLKIKRQNASKE